MEFMHNLGSGVYFDASDCVETNTLSDTGDRQTMSLLEIQSNKPGYGKIQLDGSEISQHVSGCVVTIEAGNLTRAVLNIEVVAVKVKMDGMVEINGQPVTDEIGRAVYESLKARYEEVSLGAASADNQENVESN